ncbi:phage baseplate assembly protein V [Pandoraea apista]|uniref:phage baseplate assembly protein V n=1 Tax=Pandoraea apista TaxID=93218 RepID=UPI0006588AB1|nr:phage baseplate assembly protein V [Pandoraea apista]ALS63667.1 baseplate assembly protein [Pandoraea apista]CFB63199.1 Bacteriophage Mu Gp45 protein [Pandoraea apista]
MTRDLDVGPVQRVVRRALTAFARALISAVNDSGGVQVVQIALSSTEVRDGSPRIAEFGFSSNPPDGSDGVVAFLGGDRSKGIVIGTCHQASRPRDLSPGESILHSQDGKSVYLTADGGIVVEAKGQPVVVNSASDVTWNCTGKFKLVAPAGVEFDTPLVKSSGDMQDNFASNPHTLADMRQISNEHTHPVKGVQGGSSSVTSDPPNQHQ